MIPDVETGGVCGMQNRKEKCTENLVGNPSEKSPPRKCRLR
jgi:hypothetical protein